MQWLKHIKTLKVYFITFFIIRPHKALRVLLILNILTVNNSLAGKGFPGYSASLLRSHYLRVTIAGASGFVGRNLIKSLFETFKIKGLSRSKKADTTNTTWAKADLFSFQSIDKALQDTDVAIYLVHSMMPSSRLFQGSFQDTDLLLADNFAKACVKNNVKQIIYLGGLVPISGTSKHLESRQEVEEVLKLTKIPVTILRAGMIVGDGGSSFEMLRNLVFNVPIMLLPKWSNNDTQALYIDDLAAAIKKSIGNSDFYNKTINAVNGEKITYKELTLQTINYFSPNRITINLPTNSTSILKLGVKVLSQADYELVSPLIDSLTCKMPSPKTPGILKDVIKYKSYKEMLSNFTKQKTKRVIKNKKPSKNNVRSIQRLLNPHLFSEDQISQKYFYWLPKYFGFFIRAESADNIINFKIIGLSKPLLILEKIKDNGQLSRVKFHIIGGLLTKSKDTGWLEFRLVAGGKHTLASINEFVPSLPWYLYKYTQALFHVKVMNAFSGYLQKTNRKN